jgi:AcrR family transcriptional regulator
MEVPIPTPARTSLAEIVTAGLRIVEADGLDGLTMQRVASAVGVKAPSLYKRVHGRDQLIRLIVEDVARELTKTLDATVGTGDPKRDLRALAEAIRAFAHAPPASYGLLFARLPETTRPDPDLLSRASNAVLRTATTLAGRARTGGSTHGRRMGARVHHDGAGRCVPPRRRHQPCLYAFGIERLAAALTQADSTRAR